jgi:hypothetical protein
VRSNPAGQGPCGAFLEDYFGQMLEDAGPGLAAAVRAAPMCLSVTGSVADPPSLDFLRDTVGVLTALFEAGIVAILDAQAFRWYSRELWASEIFDPAGPVPRHHVSILLSEDASAPEGLWFHTRGMRKFGRPDVSVRGVPPSYRDGVIDLCNRFIEMMAFGAIIPEGQPIKMHALPSGLRCHHAGDLDDPEFNNVHVEIAWPR